MTSDKKRRGQGDFYSDIKPTYNTDRSEKTSKMLADKSFSDFLTNEI